MSIFNSPAAFALRMRIRAATIDRGLKKTTRLVAEEALKRSKAAMQRGVYDHPIPLNRRGQPQWARTGLLYQSEKLEYSNDGTTVKLINTVRYAEVRHEMGKAGRRRTNYPAHWRDEMREAMRDIVGRTHHRVIQNAFADLQEELTTL